MTRSVWKGPFVDMYLIKKAEAVKNSGRNDVIKTWSRRSTILPEFVGLTFGVHNGKKHIPVTVNENMVGHKFGEFSPTRTYKGHNADKKDFITDDKMAENLKNIATAKAKSLKTSPQKANIVLKSIRGKKAENAINILSFSRKRISNEILKVLKSAIANAENNHQLDIDKLFVKEATVGKAMVLKGLDREQEEDRVNF